MSFEKYTGTNNAVGNLNANIGTWTSSLVLQTNQWWLFPSVFPFLATIVQYATPADPTTAVVKREIVKVTNRSGDTLTVTRAFEACPASDTATTQTTTAQSFDSWDFVYLWITALTIDDIQDELDRLETDKLDASWELRTWLWNWKVIYTNWSWVEVELAVWAAWTFLWFNGTSSAPSAQIPTTQQNVITGTAGETVDWTTTPQAVYVSDWTWWRTSWRYYKADANDWTNTDSINFAWFVTTSKTVWQTGNLINTGIVDWFTWLTEHALYFMSDTAWEISVTPSTTKRIPVWVAITWTQILILENWNALIDEFGKSGVNANWYTIWNITSATTGNLDIDVWFGNSRIVELYIGLYSSAWSWDSKEWIGKIIFTSDATWSMQGFEVDGTSLWQAFVIDRTDSALSDISSLSSDLFTANWATDHYDIQINSISRSGNNIRFSWETTQGWVWSWNALLEVQQIVAWN